MDIAFVMYPSMTALDLIGPYEILARQREVRTLFVAATRDPIRCDVGLVMQPTTTFTELTRADIMVVPGSGRPFAPLKDEELIDWLRALHPTTTWTASVCTGSTLLAAAGVLAGRTATTHWSFREVLASYGVTVSTDRIVVDGDVLTAAGVSAGIDMALRLTGMVWGDEGRDDRPTGQRVRSATAVRLRRTREGHTRSPRRGRPAPRRNRTRRRLSPEPRPFPSDTSPRH